MPTEYSVTSASRNSSLSTEGLPKRFRLDESGLYEGNKWVCPAIEVIARTSNFDDRQSGKLIRFRNWAGDSKQCVIELSRLFTDGNECLFELIDLGFKPQRDRIALNALKDFIVETEPQNFVRCVSKIGWHAGSFVLPELSVGPPDAEKILFQPEGSMNIEHQYRASGSLADWKRNVANHCVGNSRLVFAVSCAFAASLLDSLQSDSAGFHFRGLSSTGKTTALLVAGSVWGGGSANGFLDTWRATANGLEARGFLHNDALMALDEMGEVNEKEVAEIVYALGNGAGKGRMRKNLTAARQQSFRLIYLSTGERSLEDIVEASGKRFKGGQEIRLVEIAADAGKNLGIFEELHESQTPSAFADNLRMAAKTYYGTPIRAFLNFIANSTNSISDEVRKTRQRFLNHVPNQSSGEIFRIASMFGMIAGAGEIATDAAITGWKPGEATRSAETCFHSWLLDRGSVAPRDVLVGIKSLRAFIEKNGNRFQEINAKDAVRDQAGFKEETEEGWKYYVIQEVFIKEVCRSLDYSAVARELLRRGHLEADPGRLLFRKRVRKERRYFYSILPSILEDC